MATPLPTSAETFRHGRELVFKLLLLAAYSLWLAASSALFSQDVQTLDLSTGDVHPLTARLGSASLIQLPVEPIATNVGDPITWLVEKSERIVSIKPVQEGARDTNLAIVTRQGTLNFSVHLAPDTETFTQMVRITKIMDNSRPLPLPAKETQETLADIILREIRIAQNYNALKMVNSPDLRDVEQYTAMRETGTKDCACVLLQTFRFRDTRHLVLHFVTENRNRLPITFDPRKTTVSVGDTLFAPLAVSLGRTTLAPQRSAENFLILDGINGLSHRQPFEILLPGMIGADSASSSVERQPSSMAKPLP